MIKVPYKPVDPRPAFILSAIGELTEEKHRGLVINALEKELDIPDDRFQNYTYHHASLDLTTKQFVSRSKSTDETITKFAGSGSLDGTVGASMTAALGKIASTVAKDEVTGSLGFSWVPGDTNKTTEQETTMTVTWYDGGATLGRVR